MTLNANAAEIAKEMAGAARKLGIDVHTLKNGATLLDCGINASGSVEAGGLFASVCLGGLARQSISTEGFGRHRLQTISVETDAPLLACIGSQKAGWKIKTGNFFALGSGPARLLLESSEHREEPDVGVIALECSTLPTEGVARYISEKCGLRTKDLTMLAARTASIVGSTQVSARMIETALYKIEYLGMMPEVLRGSGTAPIAPVKGKNSRMMGVENDMIIYGSTVYLEVDGDVDIESIPSKSSKDYGTPFMEAFKAAGYDFYKIDQGIFSPAKVTVKNIETGEIRTAGEINLEMIERILALI